MRWAYQKVNHVILNCEEKYLDIRKPTERLNIKCDKSHLWAWVKKHLME